MSPVNESAQAPAEKAEERVVDPEHRKFEIDQILMQILQGYPLWREEKDILTGSEKPLSIDHKDSVLQLNSLEEAIFFQSIQKVFAIQIPEVTQAFDLNSIDLLKAYLNDEKTEISLPSCREKQKNASGNIIRESTPYIVLKYGLHQLKTPLPTRTTNPKTSKAVRDAANQVKKEALDKKKSPVKSSEINDSSISSSEISQASLITKTLSTQNPTQETQLHSLSIAEEVSSVPAAAVAPLPDRSVFLFPGQGTQYVGMASEVALFPKAKQLFENASKILGYDLLHLCQHGPQEKLNQTEFAQPAIFVSSLAALERLRVENPSLVSNCVACAGLSLGEFSALVFSGALTFEDGLRIVQQRAIAMQKAAEKSKTGMVSVIGSSDEQIQDLIAQVQQRGEKVYLANRLLPGNSVLSGDTKVMQMIRQQALLPKFGAQKVIPLQVAGAFHSPFMQDAAEALKKVMEKVVFSTPQVPVYANVDALPHVQKDEIPQKLIKQLTHTVQWSNIMMELDDRQVSVWQEVGPGTVLCGLARRMQRLNLARSNTRTNTSVKVHCISIGKPSLSKK